MMSQFARRRPIATGRAISVVSVLLVASALAPPAGAQTVEREPGWSNSTELGWVFTAGNAQTSSFNLRNVFEYRWATADLSWEFGILRADSGDDRFALGTVDDFEVIEPPVAADNERVYNKLRYIRDVSDRVFWYVRFDLERDVPADIIHRSTPSGGAGNNWATRDELTFRTGYGVSYSVEELSLDGRSDYFGYQFFYELKAKATETTTVDSNMTFDGSVETGSNYRFNWYNGVSVAMTERLALKASLRVVYRNDPALEAIDLQEPDGGVIGSVVVPKKKFDSAFTASLVINF